MSWTIVYLYLAFFGFFLSLILTRVAKGIAYRLSIVNCPRGDRFNKKRVALLGGLAVVLSTMIGVGMNVGLYFYLLDKGILPAQWAVYQEGIMKVLPPLLVIISAGIVLSLLGFYDDLQGVGVGMKLAIQILVGVMVVLSGIKVKLFIPNVYLQGVCTVGWIVLITNAFNLQDNIDGLCSGLAFLVCILLFFLSSSSSQYFVSSFLILLCGILGGFLVFNFPPASIFLGDMGSLYLGYMVSVMTMLPTYYNWRSPSATVLPVFTPLLLLSVPLFDTISVIIIRIKKKQSIFRGDTNHLSHRLVRLGFSPVQTIFFIYSMCLTIGAGTLLLPRLDLLGAGLIFFQALCLLVMVAVIERTVSARNGKE